MPSEQIERDLNIVFLHPEPMPLVLEAPDDRYVVQMSDPAGPLTVNEALREPPQE